MFKVYCTDLVAPSLPPGAMPLAFLTEIEALRAAFRLMRLDHTVWKIERPDGTVIGRDEIEFIYRNTHPPGSILSEH